MIEEVEAGVRHHCVRFISEHHPSSRSRLSAMHRSDTGDNDRGREVASLDTHQRATWDTCPLEPRDNVADQLLTVHDVQDAVSFADNLSGHAHCYVAFTAAGRQLKEDASRSMAHSVFSPRLQMFEEISSPGRG
jgi:hypothetical protein